MTLRKKWLRTKNPNGLSMARVTRCEDAKREHRKFFLMENGQVWKQANVGRMSLRDRSCQFDVMIRKDAFGWVMEIPSEKRKVRVKRVR